MYKKGRLWEACLFCTALLPIIGWSGGVSVKQKVLDRLRADYFRKQYSFKAPSQRCDLFSSIAVWINRVMVLWSIASC